MSEITIRTATFLDLFSMAELGRLGWEEAGTPYPRYDVAVMLKDLIDAINHGLVFIAEMRVAETDFNMPIGGLVMSFTKWPHSPNVPLLTNEHLFVLPDHRSKKTKDGVLVGKALLNIMLEVSDGSKTPILFRSNYGKNNEAIQRLMEQSGFMAIGHTFLYQPAVKDSDKAA
jgi:hypothetical protein